MRHFCALIFLLFTYLRLNLGSKGFPIWKTIFLLLFVFSFSSLNAQTFNSNGGGDWDDPNSWDVGGGQTPGTGDIVNIINGDVINVNFTTTVTVQDLNINGSTLQFTAASGRVNFSNDLTATGTANIIGSSDNHRIVGTTTTGELLVNTSATLILTQTRLTVANKGINLNGELRFVTGVTVGNTIDDLTVNSGGTFNNASTQNFTLNGNIVNNSSNTFTGCSTTTGCNYTVSDGGTHTFSGTGTTVLSRLVINNDNTTVTSQGTLEMTDDIIGNASTGNSFINQGTLRLNTSGALDVTDLTFDFSTSTSNTVVYIGSTSENLLASSVTSYHNVQVDMDAITNIVQVNGSDVDINGNLTVNSGRLRVQTANVLNVDGNVLVTSANAEFEPNVASATTQIDGDFTLTGGLYDQNNGAVTIDGTVTVNSGTFTLNNAASTLDVNTLFNVVGGTNDFSTGTFTPSAITIASGQAILIGSIDLTAGGTTTVNGTLTIDGATGDKNFNNMILDGTGTINFTVNETLTLAGDLTMSGASPSIPGGTASRIVNVGGAFNVTATTATISDMTLNVTGLTTVSGNLVIDDGGGTKTLGDLTLNSNGNINISVNETLSVGGNLSMSGTSSLTGGGNGRIVTVTGTTSVPSGTATIGDIQFNANGATTIDGTLAFSSTSGNKTFSDVTLNASGTWNNGTVTEVFTITGNLVNNGGTWTGCSNTTSCTYTLTSTSGTISGSGTFNFTDLFIDGSASYTNTGTVVMTDNITGTGAFINGNGGVLELRDNGTYSISTLTLNTNSNVVRFAGGIAETITLGPFYNLEIDMDAGIVAFVNGTDITVENNVTVTDGIFRQSANTLAITGSVIVNGGQLDLNTGTVNFTDLTVNNGAAANVQNSVITSSGTMTIDNGTFTTDGAGGTYNYNNITVNANGTWNVTAAYDPTISGSIINNGTFTGCNATGCIYTFSNATASISGSSAMNNMSTINLASGVTLTNTNSGGFNVTNSIRDAAANGTFVNGVNGVLSYSGTTGNFSVNSFTASANPNTVTYNRTTTNQLIEPTSDGFYHNLTIAKANTFDATTNTVFTINGTLTMTDGDLIMGGQNLIIGSDGSISGGSTSSFIQQSGAGRLIKTFSSAGASITYPLGVSNHVPLDFNFDSFSGSGNVTFSVDESAHPDRNVTNGDGSDDPGQGDDIGPDANNFLNVYWTVDIPSGITAFQFDASGDFTNVAATTGNAGDGIVPVIQRELSSVEDWHVVGVIAGLGEGEVSGSSANFRNINNNVPGKTINERTAWILYAMDNRDNGSGKNRLPITLVSFDAKPIPSGVELNWVTADEENNDFFTIERSSDGIDFQTILQVPGAGNSYEPLHYRAVDISPFNGRNYYRLKQTDFNGDFSYSDIELVNFSSDFHDLVITKNNISAGESIEFRGLDLLNENASFYMYDINGRVYKSVTAYQIKNDGFRIPQKGLYLIRVVDGSFVKTFKVLAN